MRCILISSEGGADLRLVEGGVRARGHGVLIARDPVEVDAALRTGRHALAIVAGARVIADTESLVATCSRQRASVGTLRPIVLAIGRSLEEVTSLLDAGADDVVCLPLDEAQLASRLAVVERRAEERLFLSVNSGGPHSFVVVDRERRIVHCSALAPARARSLIGAPVAVGMSIEALAAPERREALSINLGKALLGEVSRCEMHSTDAEGARWYEVVYSPVFGDGGEVEGVCIGVFDIEERHRGDEALVASERRFRGLINGMHDLILVIDATGKIMYQSPSSVRMTGVAISEREGSNAFSRIHPEDQPRLKGLLTEILARPSEPVKFRHRTLGGNGKWMVIDNVATNLLADPSVNGIVINARDDTERTEAEAARVSVEQSFRRVFNASPVGKVITRAATDEIIDANDAYQKLFGMTVEVLRSRSTRDLFADPADHLAAVEEIRQGRMLRARPSKARTHSGEIRDVEAYTEILDFHGERCVLTCLVDVTERLRADEALRRSESRFRRMFDSSLLGIYSSTGDGRITEANDAFLGMLGYDRDDLARGRLNRAGIRPPGRDPRTERDEQDLLETGPRKPFEKDYRHKDGRRVPVMVAGARLDPKSDDSIAFVIDNTERRRSEEALRRSEASFRALIESAPDAIVVHRGGRIIYANPQSVVYLGYERAEELLARPMLELIHPDDRGAIEERGRAALQGQARTPREYRVLRRDGAILHTEIVSFPVMLDGEQALMAFCRDLTERKKVQSQLLLADRMVSVGTLAAGVAHEINNPLAYISANLQHVAEALADDARAMSLADRQNVREALSDAREGAERVRLIVRDLKTFSRGEEEKRGPVDVRLVIESSINMAWNEIRHRAQLTRDHGEVPMVEANEARLGQVFLNLLVNAAQAIPEGDASRNVIRVATRVANGRVVVEVADSGSGIPVDVQRRMFDPFFTTKAIGVGTGLGLSISHGIVSALGGTIEFDSEPGKGTRFRVILPPSERVTVAAIAARPVVGGRRGRILVVDDEPLVLKSVRRLLSAEHDVTSLASAREASVRIRTGEEYDVILCDLMMPDMTGIEFHEEMARVAPAQVGRIVFVTGGAFTARARTFLDTVANPRVEKPFDAEKLRGLVRSMIH